MTPYSCLPCFLLGFFLFFSLHCCCFVCDPVEESISHNTRFSYTVMSVVTALLISQTATRAGHVTCVCFTFQNGFMMMMK